MPLMNGFFKLNMDGACRLNTGRRGTGGIVRNSNGEWVLGFFNSFHNSTNNMMELLALKDGLKVIESNNFLPVEINIDSLEVLHTLTNGNLHYDTIIDDCRASLSITENPPIHGGSSIPESTPLIGGSSRLPPSPITGSPLVPESRPSPIPGGPSASESTPPPPITGSPLVPGTPPPPIPGGPPTSGNNTPPPIPGSPLVPGSPGGPSASGSTPPPPITGSPPPPIRGGPPISSPDPIPGGIDLHNHPIYKDKNLSDLSDVLFADELVQQSSESLDCGLYVVTYAECLSYGKRVPLIEFNPNTLRTCYTALLWDYIWAMESKLIPESSSSYGSWASWNCAMLSSNCAMLSSSFDLAELLSVLFIAGTALSGCSSDSSSIYLS
ncbi:hypothetical protein BC332_06385 [Capsicum chinense]|nr:hypothetical protein BC332_06385 [Capsicum chinense]